MPVRVAITQGTTADCTIASTLIEGLDAEYLLADRGYDTRWRGIATRYAKNTVSFLSAVHIPCIDIWLSIS